MIPADYWILRFWRCRKESKSPFTFPFLSVSQRLFPDLKYLSYHIKSNPILAEYYEDPLVTRLSKDRYANPGIYI